MQYEEFRSNIQDKIDQSQTLLTQANKANDLDEFLRREIAKALDHLDAARERCRRMTVVGNR